MSIVSCLEGRESGRGPDGGCKLSTMQDMQGSVLSRRENCFSVFEKGSEGSEPVG